ncbi:hypothetical protein FY528_19180 [Hymenobacter lutimineralis]|uniref:Uncharacterized protein n=1 Tax=Hymenobacter lutimineralis TaxID=2606448 RepID=A0A5D6UR48_9BACT|nr:hypothetical protein [Hymenobacter lutimineralis]TYZ06151.1 hypothetical protein FY528_19180 [Hymenobacter lutimineralis]
MAVSVPIDHFTTDPLPLEKARAWLALVLNHPAFSIERRQKAGQLMAATSDAWQVCRWAVLALVESERWEDAMLSREEA